MDIKELEAPIQEIITLVEKLNEKYREKCFEILLSFYLKEKLQSPIQPVAPKEIVKLEAEKKEFIVPIDVKAFLQENDIQEEQLKKLFYMQEGEIRPIYKITTIKKATAQIHIALLTALQSALGKAGSKFEFSEEFVRQRSKDLKAYDAANFTAIFKKNAGLFKSLDDPEHVELSADGRTELADVISAVAK